MNTSKTTAVVLTRRCKSLTISYTTNLTKPSILGFTSTPTSPGIPCSKHQTARCRHQTYMLLIVTYATSIWRYLVAMHRKMVQSVLDQGLQLPAKFPHCFLPQLCSFCPLDTTLWGLARKFYVHASWNTSSCQTRKTTVPSQVTHRNDLVH